MADFDLMILDVPKPSKIGDDISQHEYINSIAPGFYCGECGKHFPLDEEREVKHPLFGTFYVCGDCYKEASQNSWVLPRAFTSTEHYQSPGTKGERSTRNTREIERLKNELIRAAKIITKLSSKMDGLLVERHNKSLAAKESLKTVRLKIQALKKKQSEWKKSFTAKISQKESKVAEKIKLTKKQLKEKQEHDAQLHRERAKRWRENQMGKTAGQRAKIKAKKEAARLKLLETKQADKLAKQAKRQQARKAAETKLAYIKLTRQANKIVRKARRESKVLTAQANKLTDRIQLLQNKLKVILPLMKAAESRYATLEALTPAQVLKFVKPSKTARKIAAAQKKAVASKKPVIVVKQKTAKPLLPKGTKAHKAVDKTTDEDEAEIISIMMHKKKPANKK